jgi:hypothetical protein
MKGYALEVQLVRCTCKSHPNGACRSTEDHKTEVLREAYLGSFGYGVKALGDALKKWDRWLHGGEILGVIK